MNGKAQVTVEAMVSFAAFLALVGLFLGTAALQKAKAEDSVQKISAIAGAKKCAAIIDSLYANASNSAAEESLSCFLSSQNLVAATDGNAEKSAFVFAPSVSMTQRNGAAFLEVKLEDHYR